ncbi:hypothetical protein Trco_000702 [Trichoderma cornu-damae]|uniref:DUF6594 domain-containing protein n=1 Tax=Trichoderma cornu-damae TaxID=654480 RepID=A0A9P8QXN1_9HYPO|nr:hypothetical protein Trco_000702 [Trichoderma cornu-damae]
MAEKLSIPSATSKAGESSGCSTSPESDTPSDLEESTIDNFPQGYPRFSALLASHKSFQLWRRFSTLRSRLLLLKQDELSQLEKQLKRLDDVDGKRNPLILGNCRLDTNGGRRQVLDRIDAALVDYDSQLERYQRVLNLETSSNHAVSNLQNWLANNGALARDEAEYLNRRRDLFSLFGNSTLSERLAAAVGKYLATETITNDKNVVILPSWVMRVMKGAMKILVAPIISILLLTPVIICNFVDGLTNRVIIVVLSTTAFIAALSCLTRVKAVDLVVAGATYVMSSPAF